MKCVEGCQCQRHKWRPSRHSWSCAEGCQCRRHQPKVHSVEVLVRLAEASRRREWSEISRKRAGDGSRGKHRSVETRGRMSCAAQRRWRDPVDTANRMKAMGVKPNKAEQKLAKLLGPLGFQYVGDGQLVIAGKRPDFWDGGIRLIELYGDHWHRGQDPQDRIDLFAAEGYDCLVVWEHELQDGAAIIARVKETR